MDKQPDIYTYKLTDTQTYGRIYYRQMNAETLRWAFIIHTQTNRHARGHTNRQTNKQTVTYTYGHTDRRTHRQTL